MVVFSNFTIALQSAPDRIVMAYIGFRILQNNQKLETQISLKICAKNWTKTLLKLVSAPLAVFLMVVFHVLVTFFELMVTIVILLSNMDVFTTFTYPLQIAPDRIVNALNGFRIQQNNKKLETQISLKICTKSWTQTLLPLVSAPLAVLLMVVAHVLVTLFELMVTIIISISNKVVFTNLTIALQSAPERIVIVYSGFRILQNNKKLEPQISLKICTKSLTTGTIATSKRTVSSVDNGSCAGPCYVF